MGHAVGTACGAHTCCLESTLVALLRIHVDGMVLLGKSPVRVCSEAMHYSHSETTCWQYCSPCSGISWVTTRKYDL